MSTFDLDFRKLPKRPSWTPARAWIYIKHSTSDETGLIHITPESVTIEELETYVKHLKGELDAILRRARKRFAADSD